MAAVAAGLERMRSAGVAPDVHSYTALMTAAFHGQSPEAADEALEGMLSAGVQPSVVTVAAYILAVGDAKWEVRAPSGGLLGSSCCVDDWRGARVPAAPCDPVWTVLLHAECDGCLAAVRRVGIQAQYLRLFRAHARRVRRRQGAPRPLAQGDCQELVIALMRDCEMTIRPPPCAQIDNALDVYAAMVKEKVLPNSIVFLVSLAATPLQRIVISA